MWSGCASYTKKVSISPADIAATVAYANQHRGEDSVKLLLRGGLPANIDPRMLADQLDGVAYATVKWPSLAACDNFAYPCRLSREQSSSETAARYKAEAIVARNSDTDETGKCSRLPEIADLTGGMGVDSLMFAKVADRVDYIERDSDLYGIMAYNVQALGYGNVTCHNLDCTEWLATVNRHYDWLYIDPARRGGNGRKLVNLADCQPNVVELLPKLAAAGERVLIKASPMTDVSEGLRLLSNPMVQVVVEEVHVVAVNHECKEVLFVVASRRATGVEKYGAEPQMHCVDIWDGGRWHNSFVYGKDTVPVYADTCRRFLYEPNAALMKCAPWGEISRCYGVSKLDRNTHLFTSDLLVKDFPGRVFEIEKEVQLKAKAIHREVGKANVVVRNYPADVAGLRRQLRLAEGDGQYLIATTVRGEKKGLLCHRIGLP